MLKIETASSLKEELAEELAQLEKKLFVGYDKQTLLCKEDFLDYVKNPENLVLIARNETELVGYAVVIPFKDAIKDLVEHDPKIVENEAPNKFYGESIVVVEDLRKKKAAIEITRKVVEELKKRGANKFAVHIRSSRGNHDDATSSFLKSRQVIRTIPNWLGIGKDFDYVEYEI